MKHCRQCKTQVADSFLICPQCGSKTLEKSGAAACAATAIPVSRLSVQDDGNMDAGDPMQDPMAYLRELQRRERTIDRETEVKKLLSLAQSYADPLAFFSSLKQEYETYYQVDDTHYEGLANRLEPALQQAGRLLSNIVKMPVAIGRDKEMLAFVQDAKQGVRLLSVHDYALRFDRLFLSVKERKERPAKILMAIGGFLWLVVTGIFKLVFAILKGIFKK